MLNFLEIRRIAEKLKILEGGIIGKIYYYGDHFCFVIHKEGKHFLKFYPKKALFLSKFRILEEKYHGFSKVLRDKLERKRIKRIYQIDNERAIKFELSEGFIIFEIMPPGRLILEDFCIDRGKIVKDFEIKYEEQIGVIENFEDFYRTLKNSDKKDVVRALAMDLRLTGKYAEEIVFRLKIDRNLKPNEISEDLTKKIFEEYKKICEEILNSEKTFVYEDTISLARLSYKEGRESDFWDGFDEFFKPKEEIKVDKGLLKEKERILKEIEALKEKEKEYRKFADKLKENIYILEEAFEKGLKEVEIDGKKIKIDAKPWEIVARYYEKAKRIKKKIERALKALDEIEEKIKKSIKVEKKEITVIEEKKAWYEKFRYFISSEGFLVVSGKDAITNEILIKKYLEDDDIVLHADIVGSPFTIIKKGKFCSEKTIREAAQFTLVYSRAWKNNVIVPVYWVYPNQVSKTPPAGQYLKKGSFMIYGKKNYVEDLKLEIAIGIKDNNLISGPKEIFEKDFVVLVPGKKDKNEIAKEILKIFEKKGYKIKIDKIISLIPGDCEILEVH